MYFIIALGGKTEQYEIKHVIANVLGSISLLLSVNNQFCLCGRSKLFEEQETFVLFVVTLSVPYTR